MRIVGKTGLPAWKLTLAAAFLLVLFAFVMALVFG